MVNREKLEKYWIWQEKTDETIRDIFTKTGAIAWIYILYKIVQFIVKSIGSLIF